MDRPLFRKDTVQHELIQGYRAHVCVPTRFGTGGRESFRIIHSLAHDTRNGRHESVQGQHTTRRQHSETQQSHTNTSPRAHTPSNPESEARATQGTGPARPPVGRSLNVSQPESSGSGAGAVRGGAGRVDADMDMGAWVEVGGHAGSGGGRAWMVGLDGGAEGSGRMVAAGAGAGSRSREAAGTGLGAESRVCGPMGTPVGKPPSGTRAGAAVASGTAGDGSGVMW